MLLVIDGNKHEDPQQKIGREKETLGDSDLNGYLYHIPCSRIKDLGRGRGRKNLRVRDGR